MNTYYIDGKFVPADQAALPVDDLAILRGIGVFDLLRTYNGQPYFLEEHVTRLCNSAKAYELNIPWSHQHICRIVKETLGRNNLPEANIRIIITGGSSSDFITPEGQPRLLVLVTPVPALPQWWYTQGIKVITLAAKRSKPVAKSINYLPAAVGLRKAKQAKAMEVIYLSDTGNALEGATSNLFAFIDDMLVTPGQGILSGITRKVILDMAEHHYPVAIRDLPLKELLSANEVFITGTNKGLVPVIQIDDDIVGKGQPGDKTRHLMKLLQKQVSEPPPV